MTRKLWMTMAALTLVLAAGAAGADEQTQARKDARHAMRQARKQAREAGHSRREAKARMWRQIEAARNTVAATEWQDAFEALAGEVLTVAAELSHTGSHKAAMNLLQRVINTVPENADVTTTLARIYDRGPRSRATEIEESEAFEQECAEETCYGFDFGPALNAWVDCLQEASSAACTKNASSAPCCVPCVPCCPANRYVSLGVNSGCGMAGDIVLNEANFDCACGKDCRCAQPPACACGEACKCKKKKPIAGCSPAVRFFARMAINLTGGYPVLAVLDCCAPVCQPCSDAIPCDDCTPSTTERCPRVDVLSSQISQTGTSEVQEVTVIRYDNTGAACPRQYQVMRTLSDDQQAVSRTERMTGTLGRFVHLISNDENGDFVQNMYDFLPCEDE